MPEKILEKACIKQFASPVRVRPENLKKKRKKQRLHKKYGQNAVN